jgi:erythromycin esterase
MKISYLKERSGTSIDLNELLTRNSVVLESSNDLDSLINEIGNAKYVLLGEASHGTHEYYTWRTEISKKLIERKNFSFIAVEGDWPDCYGINRFVKNYPDTPDKAQEVLHEFKRWPTWMWANWEIVVLANWLKKHNSFLPKNKRVGFYGLDVYSLWDSLDAIINYLDKKDIRSKQYAIDVLKCFEPYNNGEGSSYAKAIFESLDESCENEVVNLLKQVKRNLPSWDTDPEAVMSAEQNAEVIVNAEKYYREMIYAGPNSWNIRDTHMVETLERLMKFHGDDAKAIVWEHNTHIGDARATEMVREGTVNVGQLLNERYNEEVYAIGFGSYSGTVIAGKEWGDTMKEIKVPDAKIDSWEFLLHQLDEKDRIIFMKDELKETIGTKEFGHRAIGVVYRPELERFGNYVPSLMPHRYDAFIYLDKTSALHPLHIKPDGHQMPETFPFGL